MVISERIEQFLPKYLSPEEQDKLLVCLKDFPENLGSRFYTNKLNAEPTVFQGDGIANLPIVDLPNTELKYASCLILSNTCDIEISNERYFRTRLNYTPIISLSKYISTLEVHIDSNRLANHLKAIRNQEITNIFYLPDSNRINESIVFLDRINNCNNDLINRDTLKESRTFTLSNYGFYLLLLKMSISFTRIAEKVDRPIE